jgi:phenylacetate-CoA ligase
LSILEKVYLWLPTVFQNVVVSIEGGRIQRRRYGAEFHRAEKLVQTQGFLRGDDLQALRSRLLSDILREASNTPFWREQFDEYGVQIKSSDPFSELVKLPLLTKDVVKNNVNRIVNPAIDRRQLLWRHTSGTTGSGLVFPETTSTEHFTWSFWWRYRRWHGLSPDMRCGYFGGRSLVPISSKKPPFWRLNRPGNQLMFSGYHLSRETAGFYLRALRDYDVHWLHGYPSMLTLLAKYALIDSLDARLPSLKCITTGAESLSEGQRSTLRAVFKVPVVQHYGQAEAAANVSECEYGQLHIDEDFSAVEMIPSSFDRGVEHLIGTNWLNPAFPLFRYDTGDVVVRGTGTCPCGRSGRLIESIDGRSEDYLLLPSGARIGRLDHIFKKMVNVNEAQFFQDIPSVVTVRIVRGPAYGVRDELQLSHEIRQRIGLDIELRIEYVESIKRGPNGKMRFVVSTLSNRLDREVDSVVKT